MRVSRLFSAITAGLLVAASVHAATPIRSNPIHHPGVDLYGDPLPDGITARLGTSRFVPVHTIAAPYRRTANGWLLESEHGITLWDMSTGLPAARIETPHNTINALIHFHTDANNSPPP